MESASENGSKGYSAKRKPVESASENGSKGYSAKRKPVKEKKKIEKENIN